MSVFKLSLSQKVSSMYGVIAGNLLILALWLWLYSPIFDYLSIIFSREDFRTNQLLLIGVVLLIGLQVKRGQWRLSVWQRPHLYLPALCVALGGSIGYLLVERFLNINTLSASLFFLASYGLLGCWLPAKTWRQGFPAIGLLIFTLPFGDHMQTFIGYPMRIATARLIQDGLTALGITSVGVDTILILENGVSHVDLPCSGVKSLWTGFLFLIAATWIERKPLNLRWLLVAGIFALLLFITNLIRVAILVLVGQVAGAFLIAEMLHIPLGVLGFVLACGLATWFLKRWVSTMLATRLKKEAENVAPYWLSPVLMGTIAVMALSYTARPQVGLAQAPPDWILPANLHTEPLPLKPDEVEWLTRDGAESADRLRFEWQGIRGSMILITSSTWRAHHRPERCFEVYGLSIDDSRTHLVNADFPLRFVSLGNGEGQSVVSATYWFQSATQMTDDYATRIWADVAPQRDRWVLVSVLFDGVHDPHSDEVASLYGALHQAVADTLNQY